jgi:hypothetical protein
MFMDNAVNDLPPVCLTSDNDCSITINALFILPLDFKMQAAFPFKAIETGCLEVAPNFRT